MNNKNNYDISCRAKATVKSEGKTKPVMTKHKMQQKAPDISDTVISNRLFSYTYISKKECNRT
jgi:hypothetical protein